MTHNGMESRTGAPLRVALAIYEEGRGPAGWRTEAPYRVKHDEQFTCRPVMNADLTRWHLVVNNKHVLGC